MDSGGTTSRTMTCRVSYYNADNCKFRKKRGMGPNWRAENKGGRGRPQPESEEDKKRREPKSGKNGSRTFAAPMNGKDGAGQQPTRHGDGHWQPHRLGGRDHWNQAHHLAATISQAEGNIENNPNHRSQWYGHGGGHPCPTDATHERMVAFNGGNGQTLRHPLRRKRMGRENDEHDHVDLMQVGGSSSSPQHAHPCDVQALAEGVMETPRRGIWRTALANILKNHRRVRGASRDYPHTLLQYVVEDMGGEVDESTQVGENTANNW